MLKFFDYYTEDENANKLIKEFVNGKILEHIECSTDLIPDDEGFLVPDDFTEMVADWFPKSGLIDEELTIPIMLSLYQKLDAEEEVYALSVCQQDLALNQKDRDGRSNVLVCQTMDRAMPQRPRARKQQVCRQRPR